MPMRVTGMFSGLDTESIIQELVSAKQQKVDNAKKDQTKLQWKQDAWKSLNTKLKNFQSKYVNNMRWSSAYTKKTTKVSNSSAVSVITGEKAVNGVQSLKIKQLAKRGYLTGTEVKKADGKTGNVDALTKMEDLVSDADLQSMIGEKITFTSGSKTAEVEIKADTTISDVLNAAKKVGLNANFDEKQKRLFISSPESGTANDFKITSTDTVNAGTASQSSKALAAFGIDAVDLKDGQTPPEGKATKVVAQDAEIELNGAKFTSDTNVFEINGLTFTALAPTGNEEVTVSTETDTDGIYDMIKGFLKEYNELIIEMDTLYNADSSKGYEPLTSEEKQAMAESEIEEWEKKIKDSLLRKDENLSSIRSSLRGVMADGIEIGGKTMYLFDFGINNPGYFNADENERNAFHIDGDPDDATTSGNADKLRSLIASEPDTVISFFSQLSQKLYTKMNDMSKSVDGYRSFGSFYDDKKMKTDYDGYESKIKDLEKKLQEYEDKWYKKFSAMETAMAKMQSNANAITGLLGGGGTT